MYLTHHCMVMHPCAKHCMPMSKQNEITDWTQICTDRQTDGQIECFLYKRSTCLTDHLSVRDLIPIFVRRAYICISTAQSYNKWKSMIESVSSIIIPSHNSKQHLYGQHLAEEPVPWGSWNLKFWSSLLHHYYILCLSDLCLGVEKKIF